MFTSRSYGAMHPARQSLEPPSFIPAEAFAIAQVARHGSGRLSPASFEKFSVFGVAYNVIFIDPTSKFLATDIMFDLAKEHSLYNPLSGFLVQGASYGKTPEVRAISSWAGTAQLQVDDPFFPVEVLDLIDLAEVSQILGITDKALLYTFAYNELDFEENTRRILDNSYFAGQEFSNLILGLLFEGNNQSRSVFYATVKSYVDQYYSKLEDVCSDLAWYRIRERNFRGEVVVFVTDRGFLEVFNPGYVPRILGEGDFRAISRALPDNDLLGRIFCRRFYSRDFEYLRDIWGRLMQSHRFFSAARIGCLISRIHHSKAHRNDREAYLKNALDSLRVRVRAERNSLTRSSARIKRNYDVRFAILSQGDLTRKLIVSLQNDGAIDRRLSDDDLRDIYACICQLMVSLGDEQYIKKNDVLAVARGDSSWKSFFVDHDLSELTFKDGPRGFDSFVGKYGFPTPKNLIRSRRDENPLERIGQLLRDIIRESKHNKDYVLDVIRLLILIAEKAPFSYIVLLLKACKHVNGCHSDAKDAGRLIFLVFCVAARFVSHFDENEARDAIFKYVDILYGWAHDDNIMEVLENLREIASSEYADFNIFNLCVEILVGNNVRHFREYTEPSSLGIDMESFYRRTDLKVLERLLRYSVTPSLPEIKHLAQIFQFDPEKITLSSYNDFRSGRIRIFKTPDNVIAFKRT